MILSFFSSQGWESWDVGHRPLIPEGMPVLIDDDLRFEDGPGAPRPSVAVNRWLRELPSSGAPSPKSWEYYARAVREWMEFLAVHGVALFDSRARLKQALGKYAGHRAAGPVAERLAATTWAQHMSILSLFYRWAIGEGHAEAEPFTYRTARALFNGTGRAVRVNLAVRRTPKPHVTIKYLEPDFTELFLDGLRGLGADDGYRGRELARNAAIGELALATGLRLQEFSYLLAYEVPVLPPKPARPMPGQSHASGRKRKPMTAHADRNQVPPTVADTTATVPASATASAPTMATYRRSTASRPTDLCRTRRASTGSGRRLLTWIRGSRRCSYAGRRYENRGNLRPFGAPAQERAPRPRKARGPKPVRGCSCGVPHASRRLQVPRPAPAGARGQGRAR